MKFLLAFLLLYNQVALANCPEDVQVVKQGDIVACDGILLSPDASKKADEAVEDAKYYKKLSEKLFDRQDLTNKEINVLDQRLKLYMDQSESLATELVHKDSDDKWQKLIYFSLGVLGTGIAVYGASQLRR